MLWNRNWGWPARLCKMTEFYNFCHWLCVRNNSTHSMQILTPSLKVLWSTSVYKFGTETVDPTANNWELRGLNLPVIHPGLQYSPNEAQYNYGVLRRNFLSRRPKINHGSKSADNSADNLNLVAKWPSSRGSDPKFGQLTSILLLKIELALMEWPAF